MRKHTHAVSGRALGTGLAIATLLTACNRSRSTASDSSTAVSGRVQGIAAQVKALSSRGESNEIAASTAALTGSRPATAPMSVAAAPPPDERLSFRLGGLTTTDLGGAMLVRHGEASVEVRRVDDAITAARKAAGELGGFIANTSVRNGKDEQHAATLELRVPSAQFDALLGALAGVGKLESVSANVEDVGEEYVDLGARAANARRVEARLVEMVATRTGKLSDVLTVEQELARVRMEIERYDARLRYLERRAAVSSLNVTLHEPLGIIDRPRPGPIVEALGVAWERLLGVIAWCIASLGLIVPLALLVWIGIRVVPRPRWPLGTPIARRE